MRRRLRLRVLVAWVLRLLLTGVLLAAALPKLKDTVTFLEQTANYDLWVSIAPFVAVTLPSVELVAALALLFGPRSLRLGATALTMGLMALFVVVVGSAYARGLDAECGCFGANSERIGPRKLLENLGLLAAAIQLLLLELGDFARSRTPQPATSTPTSDVSAT